MKKEYYVTSMLYITYNQINQNNQENKIKNRCILAMNIHTVRYGFLQTGPFLHLQYLQQEIPTILQRPWPTIYTACFVACGISV